MKRITSETCRKRARATARASAHQIAAHRAVILDDAQIEQLADMVQQLGTAHIREALAFGTPLADFLITEQHS